MDHSKDPQLSIVVCTRNRAYLIGQIVAALMEQEQIDPVSYEVLIVDNHSSDSTSKAIAEYGRLHTGRIRCLQEPKGGLAAARNFGISEAKGSIVAFTDDDCIPDRLWARTIIDFFTRHDAEGVGGRVLLLNSKQLPSLIVNNLDIFWGPLAFVDRGEEDLFDQKSPIHLVGANMAFRKRCFGKYGVFRTDLGLGSGAVGEDTEFFERLFHAGATIGYCGKILVLHQISRERVSLAKMTDWYFMKIRFLMRTTRSNTWLSKTKCGLRILRLTVEKVFLITFRCLTGYGIGTNQAIH